MAAALEEVGRRRRRRVHLGTVRLREEGIDPDEVTWSPTPYQPAPQVPVSDELRDQLRKRLEAMVTSLSDGPEDDPEPDAEQAASRVPRPTFHAGGPVFAAACSACGGLCCRQGLPRGAFLTPATFRRVIRDGQGRIAPADLVDLYLSHLGPTHAHSSCLFHGERGCRLPREIRGDTCNRWICEDLENLFLDTGGGEGVPPGHVFVAMSRDGRQAGRVVRYDPDPSSSSRAKAESKAVDDGGKSTART